MTVTIKKTGQRAQVRYKRLELGAWVYFLQDAQGRRIYNGQFSGFNECQLIINPL